ncbi:protein wntless homolog [Lepeophtheirus salmonis]|uniref:protein wntless homolog n=1 Tax=Lepeophtheirus salmonis TaxID=72036 RepID=UPI001AE407A0|nr:protein wntless-like [Lepeophtheirus salmonis]
MSEAFGTLVMRLGKGTLLASTAAILTLHCACYLVALITAPKLFHSDVFIPKESNNLLELEDMEISHWNRRLIGSLEFYTDDVTLPERTNISATLKSVERTFAIQGAPRELNCQSLEDENKNSTYYYCSINPLIDLQLIHDNETFEILFNLWDFESSFNQSFVTRMESSNYHKTRFFFKCLFTPGLILALSYFSWKIHVNDLYISIPDRCLIVSGIALLLRNIPVQVIFHHPYLALYEPLTRGLLLSSLYLFWLIYSGDKISEKESWERNSRYYWKQIVIIGLFAVIYILHITYSLLVSLKNPFKNHWNSSYVARIMSYAFILSGTSVVVFLIQIFLSVTIFKTLFLQRGRKGVSKRIGWTLIYIYFASLITSGDYLLQESVRLLGEKYSLRQSISEFASILLIGAEGFWNLHIITCFILLSRPSDDGGLNNVTALRYGARSEGERKDFDEVMGLSIYNHLLEDKK